MEAATDGLLVSLRKRGQPAAQTLVAMLLVAGGWQLVSLRLPDYIVPGWEVIGPTLLDLEYNHVLTTGLRVLAALGLAFSLGLVAALLLSSFPRIEGYIMPMVKMLMAVPAISWIIFAVLWFSSVEQRIAFVLIVECGPIFFIQILDGIKQIPAPLRDMMRAFRPSRAEYYRKLIIPGVIPTILTSWKITLGLAIRVVTIAELVGAVSGVGYALVISQQLFSVADVFAWTMVLVIMLLTAQFFVSLIESRLLKWRS